MSQSGTSALGRAKDIDCPVCKADKEQACKDEHGQVRAPHMERGRMARWAQMGVTA